MKPKRKQLLDSLPSDAKKYVTEAKTKLVEENYKGNNKPAYTKLQFKRMYLGYDFLQNLAFVRAAVMKKYGINRIEFLEIVLFLTPMNIFTLNDFRNVSNLRFTYRNIDSLVERGFITTATEGRNRAEHFYTPTSKSRKLVQDFYEMLSGEIPIEEELLVKSKVKSDRVKADIIKKLNSMAPSQTRKSLWAREKK